jgi:hypothetical protein
MFEARNNLSGLRHSALSRLDELEALSLPKSSWPKGNPLSRMSPTGQVSNARWKGNVVTI